MFLLPSLLTLIIGIIAHLQAVSADTTFPPGVLATGTMGITNPPAPTMGTALNQSSYSRLLTLNTVDDFCLFAPPTLANISDSETLEVAYCLQQRNDARLIPDGTLTGLTILKTDFYIQAMGYGSFTNLNIPYGDEGGELDPHGATGAGNPVGGNVTSNVTGTDESFAEWMLYIDYNMFCFRICTNANATFSAAEMCWHELDEMGCEFVMPAQYNFNGTFQTCDADVAMPPGWYPTATVSGTTEFSTFAQYFTGVISGTPYTVGDTVTPTAPYFTPAQSNCVTVPTVSNGVKLAAATGASGNTTGSAVTATASPGTGTGTSGAAATGTGTGGTSSANGSVGSMSSWPGMSLVVVLAGIAAGALIY